MGVDLHAPLICIVGPTASGKTQLAQALAEARSAAVLSADSMQIYKGMDIGTGKIAPSERTVDYFGLDLVRPNEAYSAALFQEYGRRIIEARDSMGEHTIVCGGTGFYVRALIDDFSFPEGEQVENPVRERYNALLHEKGAQAVWDMLFNLDAASAQVIPVNDSKRVIRALELAHEGLSYAEQKDKFQQIKSFYPSIQLGLSVDPEILKKRIDARVDSMLDDGLVDEVKTLLSCGYKEAITASQAIGYKEIVAHLNGECGLDEAVDAIKRATRQYAKRQRTWFNKDKRIVWLDANDYDQTILLTEAKKYLGRAQGVPSL